MSTKSAVRLYALLSRDAPVGVIFRRGPGKQVLLIKWNLDDDTFEHGQWFKGKIYERRCDISPEGDMLLYFAASFRKPYYSWSAISRPPYLTALALWPKGDCWGGGGHFESRGRITLNHRPDEMTLAPEFQMPKWLSVGKFGEHSGWGEDDPVWGTRLKRDGWKLISWPEKTKDDFGAKVWMEFDPPIVWEKPHPTWPKRYILQMRILGLKEKGGPWYIVEHSLLEHECQAQNIGRSDWADWSPDGGLLFAQSGCMYRLHPDRGRFEAIEVSKKIADFADLEFEPIPPAPEARQWPPKKA